MNRVMPFALVLGLVTAGSALAAEGLTLREAVERALARAPQLTVAREAAREGAEGVEAAGSPFRPYLHVETTPGYSTGLPLAVAGEVPSALGATARLDLWDPGRKADLFSARAKKAELEGTLDGARQEVARLAAAEWVKCEAAANMVAAARARLTAREAIAGRVQALLREGRRTPLDSARAELDSARARERLLAAESDRELDLHELRRLVGWPGGVPLVLSGDFPEALPEPGTADALAAARSADPGLKALAAELEAQTRSARLSAMALRPVAQGEFRYAYVPLGFGYDKYYLKFKENVASVGVSLVVPILTGGRETAEAAQADARLSGLKAEFSARGEELESTLMKAEADLADATLKAALARRAQGVAGEAVRLAVLTEKEGRSEDADAVDRAKLEQADADEEVARATIDLLLAKIRLLVLRGELPGLGASRE